MHEEEKAGHLDYKGYIKKIDLGTVRQFRYFINLLVDENNE